MTRRLCLLLVCLSPALAHWSPQPELPDWAQRGKLYWCLHYARTTRALVDLFADGGQTLIHGGNFDSPATAEYARQKGLRSMPYVCSRTVTTAEIAKQPALRDAVVLKPDKSEFLAYDNPVRRYGCLFTPAWPEYVRERTREVWDLPDTAAVFYDNVYVNDDHRPEAVAAWQAWATAHGLTPGDGMPRLWDDPQSAASRAFNNEALVAYYQMLQDYDHQHNPPLLISPNLGSLPGYGMALVESGAIDLVFYETMSHPPFENNALRYKIGLAAGHGRPTGILAYLPEKVGAERGVKTWNEGMHYNFYPSSPLPEEFSLAIAEAAANGGVYIPAYNLFPSLPITDLQDPFCRRIHRAIKQGYGFLHANEPLYTGNQPGADVALLYSSATTLQDYRHQNLEGLARALGSAGIPFDVADTQDLSDNGLAGVATLVVPNLSYADQATADGLLAWAQAGGRVILTGSYAATDPIGRPARFASAAQLTAPLRLVTHPIRDWQLEGFVSEGPVNLKATGKTARASLRFDGQAGRYRAYISLYDENDGESSYTLAAGEKTVFEGKLDLDDEKVHWTTTPPFDLAPGQMVALTVHPDGGEMGRLQAVLLAAADGEQGARVGKGEVIFSPVGLEERPGDLVTLLRPRVRVAQPGRVYANVMTSPGLRAIHLVNYDFRYEVEHPGLYATDDGSSEARTYFAGQPVVVRKQLRLGQPEQVVQPVLQVFVTGTADNTADMVVALNGKPAGRVSTAGSRGWLEMPLDRALLAADNQLELRAEGRLDMDHWFQIGIDTGAKTRGSWFSIDGGKTYSSDDLSADLKQQQGEYLIRIVDQRPGGAELDPSNLAQCPGFEQVKVPHAETKLTVAPAENVAVWTAEKRPSPALAISPDGPPVTVTGTAREGGVVYTVPRVGIYTVLLLGNQAALEAVRARQQPVWDLPPVTEPLRATAPGWDAYEEGFTLETEGGHTGGHCVSCRNTDEQAVRGLVQVIEVDQKAAGPITLTAWSRAEGVSGTANGDYSLYVDATCTDGSVYHGHNTPFAVGTHDWQEVTLRLESPKPLKSMRVYLLFRRHSGRVWFDDVRVSGER